MEQTTWEQQQQKMAEAESAWLLKRKARPALRVFLLVLGGLTLVLGIIGILVPILPTTPFLLVSAWSWLRSSTRLYQWLVKHRILGGYIRNYLIHKAVTRNARRFALIFLWTGLSISFWLVGSLHVRIALVVVGLAVSTHLMLLKTIDPRLMRQKNEHVDIG